MLIEKSTTEIREMDALNMMMKHSIVHPNSKIQNKISVARVIYEHINR